MLVVQSCLLWAGDCGHLKASREALPVAPKLLQQVKGPEATKPRLRSRSEPTTATAASMAPPPTKITSHGQFKGELSDCAPIRCCWSALSHVGGSGKKTEVSVSPHFRPGTKSAHISARTT